MPFHVRRHASPAPIVLAVALIGLSLPLPACHDPSSRTRLQSALDQARARWADAGLTSYAVTQWKGCFCPPPHGWTVVVENGAPSFIASVEDGGPPDRRAEELALEQAMTVEDLFDWIQDNLDTPGSIDAAFDPALGYPTSVSLDPIPGAVDDEIGWVMEDLTPTGACTEIACADAFLLTVHAPTGGFTASSWKITVATFDGFAECTFQLVACGGGFCAENASCGVFLDSPTSLVVAFPPVPGVDTSGGVAVTAWLDGMQVLSANVPATEIRSQPNGPLCPPVCWTASGEIGLP